MCLKELLEEILILIKFGLLFVFGHWAKRNRPSCKIVSEWMSKLHFMFPKKFLRIECFWRKCFSIIFDICVKEYQFLSIFSRQDFQNCFLCVQKDVLRKTLFWRSLIFFKFHFRTLSEKSSVSYRHVFRRIVKTAIYLPIGTNRGRNTF